MSGLQLVRSQRAGEGIAVKPVVALDADIEGAVAHGPGDAEEDIPVGELAPVQRDARALVDLARQQLRGTGDAAAVTTAIRQRQAPRLERVEQRLSLVDPKRCAAPVGKEPGLP